MEIPLSQDSIDIIYGDTGCQAEVRQVGSARQVSSARLDMTTCDLTLRLVITCSPELRFGFSLTLWKAH